MKTLLRMTLAVLVVVLPLQAGAQTPEADERKALKLAALEALMSASPDKAIPTLEKVLSSRHDTEIKQRALFVLSQFQGPRAQALLVDTARSGDGELGYEAIRMIGINGDPAVIASLEQIYSAPDATERVRDAVLDAYSIAGDEEAVYEIAANAATTEEFERAVHLLGAMGANEQLRRLSGRAGDNSSLIEAYAVSGDLESLRVLIGDAGNPEQQVQAVRALGIIGGSEIATILVDTYRNSDSDAVRRAALEGLAISGDDGAVLDLYRQSNDAGEKRELLRTLTMMDSDELWAIVDEALSTTD